MIRKTLVFVCVSLAASTALAQTNGGTGAGLDKLDERQVMGELAKYNMTSVLERDFQNFDVPANEREQELTLIKLQQLANPVGLNVAGRRALALSVARGLDGLLPRETDPKALYEQANELFRFGIIPTVTALEYFGENPAAQADLKPAATTVKKMYAQVAAVADAKLVSLAKTVNDRNKEQTLPQLRAVGEIKTYGAYSDNMATYALCISLPKDDPQRKKLADDTITYLRTLDNPDLGVQPTVRLQIGKLQLAEGSNSDARATFQTVSDVRGITPPPDLSQQNDARYFSIVAEISARKFLDAQKDLAELETWEISNYLPHLPGTGDQASVKAALSMLKFRLYSSQSDLASDADQKKKTNDQAIEVLAQLISDQPNLKDLVFDQLIGRIPGDVDMTTLNPLVLEAMEQQGVDEVLKKPDETADAKKVTRAIAAAKEIINRKGQPGVDDAALVRAMQFIAYGYDRLDQKKEAAVAFLDFAQAYPGDKVKATDAMDHATAIVGELRKKDRTTGDADPDTRKLYDRFLPMAINPPYNRKVFAFQYAVLLQEEHKYKDAVEYFKQVPETDKSYPNAQFLEMVALTQELNDNSLAGDDRKAAVSQILDMAGGINTLFANAKSDEEKQRTVAWVISADEITADLTRRELKDPAKSLKILDGFETKTAISKDADKAHIQALQLRIDDYRDMGNIDEATKDLVALMSVNQEQGQTLMFSVLKTVDNDMETAKSTGNTADLKRLAQDRAQLSGFVVSWAGKSKDPKDRAQLPHYELYDADSKREAAELLDDPTARKAGLEEAYKEYQDLIQKQPDEMTVLAAQLGLGLSAYSLGQYQEAVNYLAPLMDNSKVLRPTKEVTVPGGVTQVVEDPQFWEANYKRLKSLVELFKQNPKDPNFQKDLADAHSYVGSLYIINGKKTGGKSFHDDFEKLKAEIDGLLPQVKK